jgi:hypothetical protein
MYIFIDEKTDLALKSKYYVHVLETLKLFINGVGSLQCQEASWINLEPVTFNHRHVCLMDHYSLPLRERGRDVYIMKCYWKYSRKCYSLLRIDRVESSLIL